MKKTLALILTILCILSSCTVLVSANEKLEVKKLTSYCVKTGIKIKWNVCNLAEKYVVYSKDETNNWVVLTETSSNSYIDRNIQEGQVKDYKVQAVNQNSSSAFAYTSYCFIKIPEINKVTNVINGLKVIWSNNDFCNGYIVMKKVGTNGKWKSVANLKANTLSFVDKNVTDGVSYYYSLKKKYNNYKSAYYQDGFEKVCVETVKNYTVKNSPKGVTLSWNKRNNVKSFLIFRKVAGEKKWSKIATVKGSKVKYIDKKATFGKKNGYYIQIITKTGLKSSYSAKQYLYGVDPKKPMIALTYDDGPAGASTNTILDTLKNNNARATFFVLGSRISSYSDTLKREAKLGCEIACHTYSHVTLTLASDETIRNEISKTNNLIEKYTGQKVKLVRAPGGSHNERVRNIIKLPMIGWSIDTRDWEHRNSTKSYNCVVNNASDGDIVLMHDIHDPTATASKSIIPYLVKKGYQLVTVSEMFDAKGIALKSNGYYYSAS